MLEDNLFESIDAFLKNPEESTKPEILQEYEADALILSFMRKRGLDNFTEDEVVKVVRWGEQAKINFSMLTLIVKGLAGITIMEDDEFGFFITPEGKEALRKGTV